MLERAVRDRSTEGEAASVLVGSASLATRARTCGEASGARCQVTPAEITAGKVTRVDLSIDNGEGGMTIKRTGLGPSYRRSQRFRARHRRPRKTSGNGLSRMSRPASVWSAVTPPGIRILSPRPHATSASPTSGVEHLRGSDGPWLLITSRASRRAAASPSGTLVRILTSPCLRHAIATRTRNGSSAKGGPAASLAPSFCRARAPVNILPVRRPTTGPLF